jgi:hypothetical protein
VFFVAAAMVVQFTLFVGFANWTEPVGAVLALLAWPLFARFGDRAQLPALFALLVVALGWRALEPFAFVSRPNGFNFVPFSDLISRGSTGFNLPLFFGKAFWYGALVWVLARRGVGALQAGFTIAALLLALEIAQMWTPTNHHVASITDPLVAIAAGIVMAIFTVATGEGAGTASGGAGRRRRA